MPRADPDASFRLQSTKSWGRRESEDRVVPPKKAYPPNGNAVSRVERRRDTGDRTPCRTLPKHKPKMQKGAVRMNTGIRLLE